MCCYHTFSRPCKRCLVWHWPPASEIGMRIIRNFVEFRVVAGRSRTRSDSPQAVFRRTCCAVALRRTAWSEHGIWHGMESVNQARPHCVNQMGKTHSKLLAARHGRGTAWARHGNGMVCVNRPLTSHLSCLCQFARCHAYHWAVWKHSWIMRSVGGSSPRQFCWSTRRYVNGAFSKVEENLFFRNAKRQGLILTDQRSASSKAKISWIYTYISSAIRYGVVVLVSLKPAIGTYKFFKPIGTNSVF